MSGQRNTNKYDVWVAAILGCTCTAMAFFATATNWQDFSEVEATGYGAAGTGLAVFLFGKVIGRFL